MYVCYIMYLRDMRDAGTGKMFVDDNLTHIALFYDSA